MDLLAAPEWIGLSRHSDDRVRLHIACPAQNPDAHAHWKLKPPSCPVTSTTSPMKKRPGTRFDSMVLGESSPVSTPPTVTSALPYPSVPSGLTSHACSCRSALAKA